MAEIGKIDIQFHDVHQTAARRRGHRPQVVEHLTDLRPHLPLHQLHGLRHQRNLSGQVYGVSDLHRLRIGADGGGRRRAVLPPSS